jgi:hypothetical protein
MSEWDDLNKQNEDRALRHYGDVTNSPGKYLAAWVVGIFLVIAVLTFGGWEVGWWFNTQNTNRTAHLYRSSYGNQQTLRDQITAQIGTVITFQGPASQRYAIVNIVCGDAVQVTGDPLPSDQAAFVAANCLDGVVRPGSQFAPHN